MKYHKYSINIAHCTENTLYLVLFSKYALLWLIPNLLKTSISVFYYSVTLQCSGRASSHTELSFVHDLTVSCSYFLFSLIKSLDVYHWSIIERLPVVFLSPPSPVRHLEIMKRHTRDRFLARQRKSNPSKRAITFYNY